MLEFIVEAVGEVIGGVLDSFLDGLSVRIASGRRAEREMRQRAKQKISKTENEEV
ncbi:MAG: hypothetical protein NC432_15230 [Roseburia sp.]|nr:hypothetical protein [Roseburia sp.]MCM1099700.1 hypothetical protein [Ruminococcus flavefaciens]